MTTDTWPLTEEQQNAVEMFATGEHLLIEAGAGAGKTATLVALARHLAPRRGVYLAFNKALTEDAKKRMPDNVEARTVHSLAWRHVIGDNPDLKARLNGGKRLDRRAEAKILGVDSIVVDTPFGRKHLAAGYLAGVVMDGIRRFCQSADLLPEPKHCPVIEGLDVPTAEGRRRGPANWEVANQLAKPLRAAWEDITSDQGVLRFTHDHYLKMWQLSNPRIDASFLMLDEAQDLSGVMREVVLAQRAHGVQLVFVGDPAQAIYGFTGATDAMRYLSDAGANKVQLTKSFRFGPEVARVANLVLDMVDDSDLRIVGHDPIPSTIGKVDEPDCILTRTNAKAVSLALRLMAEGREVAIAKALKDGVISFAKAADQLAATGWTTHPELAPFKNWGEVQDFVDRDVAGSELALLVKLVDEFGSDVIQAHLADTVTEAKADVVLSTAHTSKGREWDSVRIAGDFPQRDDEGDAPELSVEEARLLYVAVTRAKLRLDVEAVDWLFDDAPAGTITTDTDDEGNLIATTTGGAA